MLCGLFTITSKVSSSCRPKNDNSKVKTGNGEGEKERNKRKGRETGRGVTSV